MSSKRLTTIDHWSKTGVFGLVIENSGQAPILLETEGDQSSREVALDRVAKVFNRHPHRWCLVRLVPVEGNELLLLDMQRLQIKEEEE